MKKSHILTAVVGLLIAGSAQAQQIPLYSNYFFTPFIYNPAQSGIDGVTEASLLHRRQWSGIEGGPETSALTVNGALNREKIGYSVYAYTDRTDIIQRTGVYGAYAYHVQLSKTNTLSFGLAAGYLDNNIDFDKIRVDDEFDPLLYPNLRRGNFDLNFGVNLNINGFQIGAAVPQLIGAPVEYSDNYNGPVEYNLIRHFVFNAQYDWEIQGDKRVLSPMVLVRTAPNVPTQIDAGAIFNMKDYGFVGAMFRSDYAITANIGVHLTEQLTVGYAYDFSTNTYGTSFGTSHEFMLTYRFGSNSDDERMESELRRLKDQLRRMEDDNEEYIRERFEEFKEELKAQENEDIEEKVREVVEGMELYRPGDENNRNNRSNPNNGGDQGGNQGGNNPNNGGTQPNNGGDRMNGMDPNGGGNTNPNNGGNPNSNNGGNAGITGYDDSNYASNVQPGSPGYYVTAGVFGSENNARRLMQRLQNQGLDVNVFQDRVNNMYYVYLMKFNNYNAADAARESNLRGQYNGRLWVKIVE
ncbi:MAG: PorP/SprF family type IX secretion system membrane protein [Flavobacteriia bacterium]|nr:PorP/SprF family type IX secretion system membrane protein [Flavobacteriia bacterium]